jgi:hypothetical protein
MGIAGGRAEGPIGVPEVVGDLSPVTGVTITYSDDQGHWNLYADPRRLAVQVARTECAGHPALMQSQPLACGGPF